MGETGKESNNSEMNEVMKEHIINDSPEDLRWAWNMVIRMREMGYHFRLAWNCYAKKMTAVFIEGNQPRKDRRQWSGRSDSLYEAVIEASANWQGRKECGVQLSLWNQSELDRI